GQITFRALAGKAGGVGAIGPVAASSPSAGGPAPAGRAKNPSRESRAIRASPAKPPPTCQRNSRRERPQGVGVGTNRGEESGIGDPHPPDQSGYTDSVRLELIRPQRAQASRR